MKAAIAIILFVSSTANAVQATGSTYTIVGFSLNDRALLQHQHVQHGITRFEVWNSTTGEIIVKQPVTDELVTEKLRAQLMQEYSIVSPGYIGPIAPDRSAAVIIQPSAPGDEATNVAIEIELYDARGTQRVATIPVVSACPTPNARHARIHAIWSPDSKSVLLAGAVIGESPCGFSNATPVAMFARANGGFMARGLNAAGSRLRTRLKRVSAASPAEGAFLAMQLLAIYPDDAKTLVTLAELRARSGDLRGALAALWRLPVIKNGRQALKQIRAADWLRPLKEKANFRALGWYLLAP